MKAEDIREFARRPRQLVREAKEEYWASVCRSDHGATALVVGHALFEHARRVATGYPAGEHLRADLDHHVRLKRLLDRASRAFAHR